MTNHCPYPPVRRISILFLLLMLPSAFAYSTGWQALNGPTGYFSPQSIIHHQGAWYVSSNTNGISGTGVWKSVSNGASWSNVSTGLPKPYARDFASFNTELFVACDTGVYRSSNGGISWTPADQGIPDLTNVYELKVHNNSLYACVYYGNGNVELFYLTTISGSWLSTGYTFSFMSPPNQLHSDGNVLWAATQAGVYKSTDNGATFNYAGNNIPFNSSITSLVAKGDTAYCGTTNGSYFTTDGGQMWMPITIPALGSPIYTYCWKIIGNNVFACFTSHGIYKAGLGQTNFTVFGTGYLTNNLAWQMASDGSNLFAATSEGIYSCPTSGGSWQIRNGNITRARTRIVVSGSGGILAGVGAFSGLQQSTNGGLTWTNAGLQNQFRLFRRGLEHNNRIFLPSNNGLHYSDDNGVTFTQVLTSPIPTREVRLYGNTLIACGTNSVLQSTDNGTTWNTLGNGLPAQITVNCINSNGSKIYAGTSNGIYQYDPLTNLWSNYSQGLVLPLSVDLIEISGLTIVINTLQSLYKRSPADSLWKPGASNIYLNDLIGVQGILFGAGSNGISFSDDAGKSFRPYNDSLPATAGEAENLYAADNVLYCGMREFSAWQRTVTPAVTISGTLPLQICAGDSFIVQGTNSAPVNPGNKYVLQLSDPNGDFYTFTALDSLTSSLSTFSLTARIPSNALAGNHYRIRMVSTSPYLLNMHYENPLQIISRPVIQWQPATQSTCEGSSSGFYTLASTDDCSYQWQVDVSGSGSYTNINNNSLYQGADSSLLIINSTTLSMDGYKYRCLIVHPCTTLVTTAATLHVDALTPILTQPVNDTICLGAGTSFSLSTSSTGNSYQWQSDFGSGFFNLTTAGGQFTGINTPALTVNFTQSQDVNRQFRCIVNGCTASDTASIIINGVPTPYVLPPVIPYCDGATLNISVQYSGDGLTYQWEQDMGTGFIPLLNNINHQGVNTPSLQLINTPSAFNNYQYRCKVNGSCAPDSGYSTSTQLQLNPGPSITAQPSNISLCESDTAVFTAQGIGTFVFYAWEMNTGNGWQPVPPIGPFTGTNSQTLTIAGSPLQYDGYQYRCHLSGCVTTQSAALNVKPRPQVVAPPISWCISMANLPLSAATPSGGTYYGNYISNNYFVYNFFPGFTQSAYDYIYTAANGCSSIGSNIIFVGNCAGTNDITEEQNGMLLFPNPASGRVQLRSESTGNDELNIRIYDTEGRLFMAFSKNQPTGEFSFDVSALPEGMYIVRLITPDRIINEKLLIIR